MSRIVVTGQVPDAAIEKLRLEHEVDAWPGPESISPEELLRRVAGGVVGMGGIGQATARRAKAFGMDVVYQSHSDIDPDVAAELGARRVEFDELLAVSDVVSLHCPYGPATHHLIGAEQFTAMKSSAYLVNTARGPIVDEAALAAALRDGAIAGAGLDVFEGEPEVHPELLELGNVALVPHLGSATIETRTAMATLAADNALAVLRGEQPPTPIG